MIRIEIPWHELQALAKKSSEKYDQLRAFKPELPAPAADGKIEYCSFTAYLNDVNLCPDWLLEIGQLRREKTLQFVTEAETIKGLPIVDLVKAYQVHLPGNALLRIGEADWIENACTEELNAKLSDGWRILAVCPQPGQRRPDYVLGRPISGDDR